MESNMTPRSKEIKKMLNEKGLGMKVPFRGYELTPYLYNLYESKHYINLVEEEKSITINII